uniref:hypothetical protein n=1 Tax=Streptomyces virginiae TaxID=1961 RepID=UPI002F919032
MWLEGYQALLGWRAEHGFSGGHSNASDDDPGENTGRSEAWWQARCLCSTACMSSALASLMAVAGTLLGSFLTFLFQRMTVDRAEAFAWRRLTREERMAAYSGFAEAVVAYRRAQYDPFHRRAEGQDSPALVNALTESYHRRMLAQQALFRVQLVTDDADLVLHAETALEATRLMAEAMDRPSLESSTNRAKQALSAFILAAGDQLRT